MRRSPSGPVHGDRQRGVARLRGVAVGCLGLLAALGGVGCERVILDFGDAASDGTTPDGSSGDDGPPPPAPEAPELIVSDVFNPYEQSSGSRSCEDGGDIVSYRVVALAGNQVELDVAPGAGCLSAGDELLLIKLQGHEGNQINVGRFELARMLDGDARQVQLVSPALGSYGEAEGTNDGLTLGGTWLVRVPNYSRVVVEPGASLQGRAWSGDGAGVLVMRALGDWIVDGLVSMNEAGFRGGPSVVEALGDGVAGESALGPLTVGRPPNGGGGGGGSGDRTTSGCVQDGNAGGGGGHVAAGEDARVLDHCDGEGRGLGGLAYASAGRLFLGAGGGSGGVDNVRVDNPPSGAGGAGGGLVFLLGQSLSGVGSIEARGAAGVGDEPGFECETGYETTRCYDHSGPGGGGAGGTIRLAVAQLGDVALRVDGGPGGNGFDGSTGDGGAGADGVIQGASEAP
ncbi:MAG TPA: hypothetical protein VLC09_08565 [Polyangiaceae bacterium]|nr:hypothetical protein [Polyangiaceae bacterium]